MRGRCLCITLGAGALVLGSAAAAAAALRADSPGREPVVVRVDDGFRWLDAGIGALAALGLAVLVLGFVLMARKGPTVRAKGER